MKLDWKTCGRVGLCAFLLFLAIRYWGYIDTLVPALLAAATPLLLGCAIAYVTNILMNGYERFWFPKSKKTLVKKMRRPACLTLSFLTVVLVLLLVIALILPQLIDCLFVIADLIPNAIRNVITQLEEWGLLSDELYASLAAIDWKAKLEGALGTVVSGVGNLLQVVIGMVMSIFGGLVTLLIAAIFAIYLLASKETLARQFTKLGTRFIKEKQWERLTHVLNVMNDSFRKFIIGQVTEAVILGLLCMIGMWILRLPYATMIGALVAFTALIPVAGAYIGAFSGAFMILTVSPVKALIFLVFIVVLQQIEGNIIYPRVVGSSIGLPGIWVLVAVTLGGGILGVLGMLLAVPLTATAYKLLREHLNKPLPTPAENNDAEATDTVTPQKETEPTPPPAVKKAKKKKKSS
ncbi:MAG: AI-2E family transporter [Ruminococcaceae bacterium]|nr:AI-2E family transporter [Oscillospiraceae bacterium]